jgi:hypothetical protein
MNDSLGRRPSRTAPVGPLAPMTKWRDRRVVRTVEHRIAQRNGGVLGTVFHWCCTPMCGLGPSIVSREETHGRSGVIARTSVSSTAEPKSGVGSRRHHAENR